MSFSLLIILCAKLSLALAQLSGPITDDFQSWLNANGYQQYNFSRTDLGAYGSYGGKSASDVSRCILRKQTQGFKKRGSF